MRSGQRHNLNDRCIGRPAGSLTIPCLACPVPGLNTDISLPKEYVLSSLTDPRLTLARYKNAKYISVDANFHLINLNKKNNPGEKPLWDGRGFIRRQDDLDRHIEKFSSLKEEVRPPHDRIGWRLIDMSRKARVQILRRYKTQTIH